MYLPCENHECTLRRKPVHFWDSYVPARILDSIHFVGGQRGVRNETENQCHQIRDEVHNFRIRIGKTKLCVVAFMKKYYRY